jgi:hypothetical protein
MWLLTGMLEPHVASLAVVVAIPVSRADLYHVAAAGAFAGFVAGGIGLAMLSRRRPSTQGRQRLVNGFLVYVLAVSCTAGLMRWNLWPFSSWAMMTRPPPPAVGPALPFSWFYGVTADGREHPVDYRAWEPLSVSELLAWMDYRGSTLPAADQSRIGATLLRQANARREEALAGRNPGRFGRFLGPLQAPTHLLFRAEWRDSADVPPRPFVGIRWYRESWGIEKRRAEPSSYERMLGFEYMAAR